MDPSYSYQQVMAAANQAADMVADELELPDCGARDIVNLVVNALGTPHRLTASPAGSGYGSNVSVLWWLTGMEVGRGQPMLTVMPRIAA